jgi:predicted nucleic acid-binding Zn finger protein
MKKTIVHGSKGDYLVSKESCTCGDYVYRKKDIGGKCKHMEMLEE